MKTWYLDPGPNEAERLEAALEEATGNEAEIVFRSGIYSFDHGILLTERHSGIMLRGEGDVRILGGRVLKNWKSVMGRSEAMMKKSNGNGR